MQAFCELTAAEEGAIRLAGVSVGARVAGCLDWGWVEYKRGVGCEHRHNDSGRYRGGCSESHGVGSPHLGAEATLLCQLAEQSRCVLRG